MEVYTLTIELVSGRFYSDWECVAEVTSDTMLIDLHNFIQNTIEFDNDHLFEFYTGRSYRNRDRVFGAGENFSLDKELESLETTLEDIYPLGRQKLYYFFDFGDSWRFQIRRANKRKKVESGVTYPRIIETKGDNPDQYGGDW